MAITTTTSRSNLDALLRPTAVALLEWQVSQAVAPTGHITHDERGLPGGIEGAHLTVQPAGDEPQLHLGLTVAVERGGAMGLPGPAGHPHVRTPGLVIGDEGPLQLVGGIQADGGQQTAILGPAFDDGRGSRHSGSLRRGGATPMGWRSRECGHPARFSVSRH